MQHVMLSFGWRKCNCTPKTGGEFVDTYVVICFKCKKKGDKCVLFVDLLYM